MEWFQSNHGFEIVIYAYVVVDMPILVEIMKLEWIWMKFFIAFLLSVNKVVIYVWFVMLNLIQVQEFGHLLFMVGFWLVCGVFVLL